MLVIFVDDLVIIGRMLVGFAVGTITGVSPVFGAEIAKTHERAKVTAVNQMSMLHHPIHLLILTL